MSNTEAVEIIKAARTKLGMTQAAVAKQIGISHRAYQRIEEGKFPKFKSDTISKIDSLLATNVSAIIYDKQFREAEDVKITTTPEKEFGRLNEEVILLKASVRVLGMTLAELLADKNKISYAKASLDLEKTIVEEVNRIHSELKKK